jgi:hypothetical protein
MRRDEDKGKAFLQGIFGLNMRNTYDTHNAHYFHEYAKYLQTKHFMCLSTINYSHYMNAVFRKRGR